MDNDTINLLKEYDVIDNEDMDIINDNNCEKETQYLEYINKNHPKIKQWNYLNEHKQYLRFSSFKSISIFLCIFLCIACFVKFIDLILFNMCLCSFK